jgi:hypothetical protein
MKYTHGIDEHEMLCVFCSMHDNSYLTLCRLHQLEWMWCQSPM